MIYSGIFSFFFCRSLHLLGLLSSCVDVWGFVCVLSLSGEGMWVFVWGLGWERCGVDLAGVTYWTAQSIESRFLIIIVELSAVAFSLLAWVLIKVMSTLLSMVIVLKLPIIPCCLSTTCFTFVRPLVWDEVFMDGRRDELEYLNIFAQRYLVLILTNEGEFWLTSDCGDWICKETMENIIKIYSA